MMIVVVCSEESRQVGIDEDKGNYGLAGCWSWRAAGGGRED